jgi:hypothetical protein
MASRLVRAAARVLIALVIATGTARTALAQAAPPEVRAPHAGVTFDVYTDGESSWLQVTPTGGFAWGHRWSVEAGLPIFHLAGNATETGTSQTRLGDIYASLSFDASGEGTTVVLAGTLGLPTGDAGSGLGANTATWDVSGHFERTTGRVTQSLVAGVGNTGLVVAPSSARQLFRAPGALFHAQGWAEVPVWRALRLAAGVYVLRSPGSAADRDAAEDAGNDEGYQFVAATDLTPGLGLSLWVSRSVQYAYNTYAASVNVDLVRVIGRRGTAPQDRRRY